MAIEELKEYPAFLKSFRDEAVDSSIREYIRQVSVNRNKKIIVLDDDPTGVQTVHDIDVLTRWDKPLLREAFHRPDHLFYILTNARAFPALEAERLHREIARNVYEVSQEEGIDFDFISRSDSTLRGHYPLDIEVLSEERKRVMGAAYDGHLIVPAFFEAGRYTADNVHYLLEGSRLVPVHRTEFAKDRAFGYTCGNLCQWVEEKQEGRRKARDCLALSIDDIRQGPDQVESILLKAHDNQPIIVNALSYNDLDLVSLGLLRAEERGKKFLYRTAASFVKTYGGISEQQLLPREALLNGSDNAKGGLVIVGSHVHKSSLQLEALLAETKTKPIELRVEQILLGDEEREQELLRVTTELNRAISGGQDVVVYSSRKVVGDGKEQSLSTSRRVSAALVEMVRSLQTAPRFIIAKGGITSSDVATEGLGIVRARVLGQALTGVPVWLTGSESRFPNVPYIIFPGNVGQDRSLAELVLKLKK